MLIHLWDLQTRVVHHYCQLIASLGYFAKIILFPMHLERRLPSGWRRISRHGKQFSFWQRRVNLFQQSQKILIAAGHRFDVNVDTRETWMRREQVYDALNKSRSPFDVGITR